MIPMKGACVFTDRWSLDELAYGILSEGPYQTNLPSLDDIISYIREDREERILAREDVVTPLPHPPPLVNHPLLILTMMMEMTKEPRVDEDVTTTHSPTTTSSSLTSSNAPSKTTSTNQTSSSQENTSSSFQSKLQISPPSSNEPTSPHHLNPLIDNISDVPPRPLNPQPLQSHHSLDITLSLSHSFLLIHFMNSITTISTTTSTTYHGPPFLLQLP
ncbi:hypothetical protein Tco_0415209 [Tanacetum coccineum]